MVIVHVHGLPHFQQVQDIPISISCENILQCQTQIKALETEPILKNTAEIFHLKNLQMITQIKLHRQLN